MCRCDGIGRRDGLKIRWWRHRVGSSPTTGTTSEQALYRLLRLFSKVRARSCRCSSFPTAIRFAGFAVGFGCRPESLCLESVHPFHVVADFVLFATTFYLKKSSLIHSVAPPFQIATASLGCDLVLDADLKACTSKVFTLSTSEQAAYHLLRLFAVEYQGVFFPSFAVFIPTEAIRFIGFMEHRQTRSVSISAAGGRAASERAHRAKRPRFRKKRFPFS